MIKQDLLKSEVYNTDCVEFMKQYPDNHWELAICDPPYNAGNRIFNFKVNSKSKINKKDKKDWNISPNQDYFNELFRVSKNQIIWGGNYFTPFLPIKRSWIFWDKKYEGMPFFSDGELAWTSFERNLKKFTYRGDVKNTIHPTQKPIKLYEWLLSKYAKEGDKILDTHGGSMSSVIACLNLGFEITCCELDKDYYKQAKFRITEHQKQQNLFNPTQKIKFID